jgi:hypothetical protein
MKYDIHRDKEGHVKVNPTWVFQLGIAIMLSIVGYFLDNSLQEIKREMEFSRIERAQLRADLTSFEIGAAGDRFTASDWRKEREDIEVALDDIRERLAKLEAQ